MFKRLMLISILAFSMIALSNTQATAWNFGAAGWGWGSYEAWYDVRGGGPDPDSVFLLSEVQVLDAALVCVNPGNWRLDVRQGKGGITLVNVTPGGAFEPADERGRFTVTEEIASSIVDFGENLFALDPVTYSGCNPDSYWIDGEFDPAGFIEGCPQAVEAFRDFYFSYLEPDQTECRNDNWVEYENLISSLILSGQIYTDCTDPNNIPGSCDPDSAADISLLCETDEPYRRWADDGTVDYICEEIIL